ncbi:hypothetical protein ACFFJT_06570 [Dyella flava]|uniref:Uncharacterized protein n=1 Tax=Dyella flava TaxID=1920170 RepID=A0ABS2JZ01_9GAMM|nr:hypothetical protein [Dyella flava]MBM7124111.1 hypothetical protein [Dyella flava]GLQ50012.1 hypothetical protein GCM10010872_14610 [Dyella flava]
MQKNWPKYDWGRLWHSYFKVIPAILLAGAIIQGVAYVIKTYLGWRVPSFVYLVLTVIALLIVRSKLRYMPSAKTSEGVAKEGDD